MGNKAVTWWNIQPHTHKIDPALMGRWRPSRGRTSLLLYAWDQILLERRQILHMLIPLPCAVGACARNLDNTVLHMNHQPRRAQLNLASCPVDPKDSTKGTDWALVSEKSSRG